MNLENILQQVLQFTGTFNLQLLVFLFLICAIGEFAITVPYLLETIWLLSGYHLAAGTFSPVQVLTLWLVAQAGRETGATALYFSSLLGSMPLIKLYRRFVPADLRSKSTLYNVPPFKLFRTINYLSPLSVAMGRLLWIRLPITLALAVRRQYRALLFGILLSSLVWDSIYLFIGVAGGRIVVQPVHMVLYSLVGLTAFYTGTFIIRRLTKRARARSGSTRPAPGE